MKKILLVLVTALFLIACGNSDKSSKDSGKTEKLKVAATPIPAGEILKFVKDDLKKEGIELEIVEFNDYVQPNKVLQSKEVDANLFQHTPYMENFGKKNGFEMTAVGKIYLPTLALYSKKIKNINELKNIKFEELSAEQLPPRLPEVAASIVNSSFALNAGLSYKEDGLVKEDKDSPYANVLATLKGNENDPRIQKLLKALQSEKVKKYMEEKYKDVIVPVF